MCPRGVYPRKPKEEEEKVEKEKEVVEEVEATETIKGTVDTTGDDSELNHASVVISE